MNKKHLKLIRTHQKKKKNKENTMGKVELQRDEWLSILTFFMFIYVQPLAPVLYEFVGVMFPNQGKKDLASVFKRLTNSKESSSSRGTSQAERISEIRHHGLKVSQFVEEYDQVQRGALFLVPKIYFYILTIASQLVYLAAAWLYTRFATDETALYNSFWAIMFVIWIVDFFWMPVYFKQKWKWLGFVMLLVEFLASVYLLFVVGHDSFNNNHSRPVIYTSFYLLIPYAIWNLYITIALFQSNIKVGGEGKKDINKRVSSTNKKRRSKHNNVYPRNILAGIDTDAYDSIIASSNRQTTLGI